MDKIKLEKIIKKVNDFPKKGITFYDITSILMNHEAFKYCIDWFEKEINKQEIDTIVAIESRGFIFGSILAHRLKKKLILARKPNKLPRETISAKYELEYGSDELSIHKEDIKTANKIAIIDDLVATGGTIHCCLKLLSKVNKKPSMLLTIINIKELNNIKNKKEFTFKSLIEY